MPPIVDALVCPRCGAPLPLDLAATPRCVYCGCGVRVRQGQIEATQDGAAPRVEVDSTKFWEAVKAAVDRGEPAEEAIRQAARTHLGVLGESDAVARLTMAIARDFDREHPGAAIGRDGLALSRIAQAYVKALPALRDSGEGVLNLPFLGVSSGGPVHLDMRLTPATIAKLLSQASHEPVPPAAPEPIGQPMQPAAPEADRPPDAPKKRGWWPFGG